MFACDANAFRLGLLFIWTCLWASGPSRADESGEHYFEAHIRPLLIEHCYACHAAEAREIGGGLRLDDRASWQQGGNSGPAIVPGDLDASLLIRAVRYHDTQLQMPPDQKLPAQAIAQLEKWVLMGAPDPREPKSTSKTGSMNPSDPIAGRAHWAFQPLAASLPSLQATHWPTSLIDQFVLAGLEAQGLSPVGDADRRDLVRRLYFQLIGLPPTETQVQLFVNDQHPQAVERLVDRLLGSPRFGERFGRHWLDLARYADSNGLDENFLFREAWRYRNWVIDAINDDLPYDQFLAHQIAGDLLPFQDVDQRDRQRVAAGFLVIGPKVLLGNDDKRQRMEVADEQLDTIGRGVLAQTLGCARCHDHKFDPVPTAEYYALAGILTSADVMERRYMLGEQRLMERLVGLGNEGDALDEHYEQYWRQRPKLKERLDQAKAALTALQKKDHEALDKIAQSHATAVAEKARDQSVPADDRVQSQQALVSELEELWKKPPAIPPRAMIPRDTEKPSDEHIRLAGQFDRMGRQVPRSFLSVVAPPSELFKIPEQESGRIQLSAWLTDVHYGAGRLTARVMANRLWQHLIGRGLVRTSDNFGRTGELPSHPELLDFLAQRLIDTRWSIKQVVREIVLSRTFALSSSHHDTNVVKDPENRYLWRSHRRRLEPELLRDAMLQVAGQLDTAQMQSSVWYLGDQATGVGKNVRRRTDFFVRSVYLPVIRNDLPELFDVFDFANPHTTTGTRPQTMVAPQGLFLLNDTMVMDAAQATAKRLLESLPAASDGQMIDALYREVFASAPLEAERVAIVEFLHDIRGSSDIQASPVADQPLKCWTMVCQAMFAMSRFQFLE